MNRRNGDEWTDLFALGGMSPRTLRRLDRQRRKALDAVRRAAQNAREGPSGRSGCLGKVFGRPTLRTPVGRAVRCLRCVPERHLWQALGVSGLVLLGMVVAGQLTGALP